jgi:hypothetical protein
MKREKDLIFNIRNQNRKREITKVVCNHRNQNRRREITKVVCKTSVEKENM